MSRPSIVWSIVLSFSWLASDAAAATPDIQAIVSHNDVVYLAPARQGWEGLPLGNGTLGAQVWQPDGLMFQLNTPLSGVYGGALCRVRLRTTPSVLTGMRTYRQRLSLYDAALVTEIDTESGNLTARCWIPAESDALVIECNDARPGVADRFLEIQTWRPSAVLAADRGVLRVSDALKLQGEPDYRFAVAAGVEGAEATAEKADEKTLRLRIPSGNFTVRIALGATRDKTADVAALAARRLAALDGRGLADARKAHAAWWSQFWAKSFIKLASDDGTADYCANLWYVHLVAMAAGSRGEVPPKFNGGLWTDQRDDREWGSAYWHWNTQETYWPIFAANHLELHRPYQEMYWRMLPAVTKWTKEAWELDGAQYQETIPFNGAMGVWQKERGVHPRVPVPKTVAHTNLILSSSAEIAMQFWWVYLYTGDEAFLRERVYPLMREVAAFYVGYLEKDSSGRYGIYPSNAHETFWKVRNPATDLAALRYFFPAILEASRRLNADAELRTVWQDRLDHLAPWAIDPATGAILSYELRPGEKIDFRNAENPDLFAVGVFPLITLGSPDHALGLKTFYARHNVNVYGWTTDSICAARLGLADPPPKGASPKQQGIAQLLVGHAQTFQDHPSGLQDYYPRKPAIHPYLEGSGTFSTAVGEMLLQSFNDVIRVCPALPAAWSADFKLLAMGGFEVTAHAERGRVRWVSLLSQRGQAVRMANPFGGPARVSCGAREVLKSGGPILEFPTEAGQAYTVLPEGASLPAVEVTAPPNNAPKRLTPEGSRWIGKPPMASQGAAIPAEPNAPKPPEPAGRIDRAANPDATPPRLAAPPKIDGDLSDEVWKSARRLGPFLRLGQASPAREQTDVLVGCDERALYLGITCWESRMDGLLVEYAGPENHDAPVAEDDSVEIFLRPAKGPVWRLAVNALGAVFDSLGSSAETEDGTVSPAWTAAVSRRSNRWIVEAAIPFSSIVADPPQKGAIWGFNVGRNERPHGETSTWSPLGSAGFFAPGQLGRLVFPEGSPLPVEKIEDPDLAGHWTFEEIRGIWVRDVSGRRHHGMTVGRAMRVVEGKVGKALEFTGGGFVDVPDAPELNLSDAMTLALWILPKQIGSMRLVDKGPAGGADAYLLDTHPENHVRVILRPTTANTQEALPVDRWTHVAVTFGQGALRVYFDGRVAAEAANLRGKITPTDLSLHLGADSQGSSRFVGLMDDVRIYRKALTAEEIGTLSRAR
jgi:alpha-L-fucosidase 2